jgi:transposase
LAAWIGLTPKEHSTGGKQRMGSISRAGNERLRRLLVSGATAVIRFAAWPDKTDRLRSVGMPDEGMMRSGEAYRRPTAIAETVAA